MAAHSRDGQLLAGRYRRERELGRGAVGRVLLARDEADAGAACALKGVSPGDEARLRWEFGLLGRIAHPNLARVRELVHLDGAAAELGLAPGSAALVYDYAPGRPADDVARSLARDPKALLALALLVGERTARALAAIHAHGIVHGDVKPANVVVADDLGDCRLVDLGLAAAVGRGAPSGTPGYMAPELWRGERRPETDVYALGVTLAELLRGAPEAPDATRSAASHLARALRPIADRAPLPDWVPPELARLVAAMTAADPEARPSRAGDVASRIALVARDAGIAWANLAGGVVGGGADDAPRAAERAARLAALPLVGQERAVRELCAAMRPGGACVVHGPPGAGRSRVVREAVRRMQEARVEAGLAAPSYRVVPRFVRVPPGQTILHVVEGDSVEPAEIAAHLREAALGGTLAVVLLERTRVLDAPSAYPVAHVEVEPLGEADVRRLLDHALVGERVPAALVREAERASGGLAGRLCRMLAEGALAGADLSKPATLRALGARAEPSVADVPAPALELAELLAVAGGELGAESVVAALGDPSEPAALLAAAGLAHLSPEARLTLRPDVAQTVRAGLSAARVRVLAARLPAAALDARARAHLAGARGDVAGAVELFLDHVRALRRRGDPEAAARVAREGLALPGQRAGAAALRVALADALRACGRYEEASEALADAAEPGALVLAAEVARLAGDSERARSLAERLRAGDAGSTDARADASALLARLVLDAGDFERARALAAPVAGPRAREVVALAYLAQGRAEDARRAAGEGLALARAQEDRAGEARLAAVLAQVARAEADPHRAAREFARAFDLAERAGEVHAAASFLQNLGAQRLDCGEPGPAIDALRDAARRLARLGRDADLGRVLYNLAYAAHLVGDDDVARSSARQAREAAARAADTATVAFAELLAGEIAERAGDLDAVARALEASAGAASLPSPERAIAHARRVSLLLALDRFAEAEHELGEATSAAGDSEDAGIEHDVAASRVALRAGRTDAARAHAERAHVRAERASTFDARLRALLASAQAAHAAGDTLAAASRFAEVRTLLDAVSRTLAPDARARLRAVDAYRRALEALPFAGATGGVEAASAAPDVRWRTLASLGKRLAAERRLPRLYESVLDAAIELAGAERGFLVLRDADGEPRVRAARGLDRRALAGEELAISRSIVQRVLATGRTLSTVDAAADADLSGAQSVHTLALRSVLALPLRAEGEPIGALYLEDRLRPFAFGEQEVALLGDLADLASLALDSARRLRAERRAARRLAALRLSLARRVETQAIELESLKRVEAAEPAGFASIVAHGPAMRRVLALAERVAGSELPVLVRGESGTGKELVAHAIHRAGPRRAAAFVSENCSAIPEALLESALFGHVRGAFTGADRRRLGLFEVADGGTLFLDEIGEMSTAMQARLLRVLEDGEVRPVGGERARHVDVRVVAATHRDLEAMVRDGTFREDLYYRLAVVTIALPPLRERPEDIAPLVQHFVEKHAPGRRVRVARGALALLAAHPWPGNVRQLENELRRVLVLAGDEIAEEHFSPVLAAGSAEAPAELDLRAQVDALERRLIRRALDATSGNQTQAARLLGISRFGLQKMIRRLGPDAR